jgi:isopenicillin N synthase-like dioxygenase
MSDIASVSLARPPADIAEELGASFAEYGFAVVRDHGIPDELIHRAEELAKQFFALPEDVKMKYRVAGGGGARGYTPFGIETAKDAEVHDLKEFWHVGRSLPEGHPLAGLMAPNLWPDEVPGFHETFAELYAAFETAGDKVLRAIALHLGLPIRRCRRARPRVRSAPRRTATSTPSPCFSGPRKPGSSC